VDPQRPVAMAHPSRIHAGAEVKGASSVLLRFEAAADDPRDGSVWYTVLVGPEGGVQVAKAVAEGLQVDGLPAGKTYTFSLVADSLAGSSRPSEPLEVALGCQGPSDACGHGICGYDGEKKAKRCFCYTGFAGEGCQDPAAALLEPNSASGAVRGGGGSKDASGRVLYSVHESCTPEDVNNCVLRFSVQTKMSRPVQLQGQQSGPDERFSLETLLQKDLAFLLATDKEDIKLKGLRPMGNTSLSALGMKAEAFAFTFDVGRAGDPSRVVSAFRSLWEDHTSDLHYGLVTSSFDTRKDATVTLMGQAAALADDEAGLAGVYPGHASLALSLMVLAAFGFCTVAVVRMSKSFMRGAGGSVRRVRVRRDSDDASRTGDDEGVEVMEVMRTATVSSSSGRHALRTPGGAGALEPRRPAGSLSSTEAEDAEARERLV
jgi:hypothetical protein